MHLVLHTSYHLLTRFAAWPHGSSPTLSPSVPHYCPKRQSFPRNATPHCVTLLLSDVAEAEPQPSRHLSTRTLPRLSSLTYSYLYFSSTDLCSCTICHHLSCNSSTVVAIVIIINQSEGIVAVPAPKRQHATYTVNRGNAHSGHSSAQYRSPRSPRRPRRSSLRAFFSSRFSYNLSPLRAMRPPTTAPPTVDMVDPCFAALPSSPPASAPTIVVATRSESGDFESGCWRLSTGLRVCGGGE
jgi:hypothetical protein